MKCKLMAGQKVVCADDSGLGSCFGERLPVRGTIYTIREVGMSRHPQLKEEVCVRLVEIVNPVIEYSCVVEECWFRAKRFVPLEEQKKGIDIIMEILDKPMNPILDQPEGPLRKVPENV